MTEFLIGKGQAVDQSRIQAVAVQAELKVFNSSGNDTQRYIQALKSKLATMENKINQASSSLTAVATTSTATPVMTETTLKQQHMISNTANQNNIPMNTMIVDKPPNEKLSAKANTILPATTTTNALSTSSTIPSPGSIPNTKTNATPTTKTVVAMPTSTNAATAPKVVPNAPPPMTTATSSSGDTSARPPPKKLTPQEVTLLKSKINSQLSGNWLKNIDDLMRLLTLKGSAKDQSLAQGLTKIKRIFLDALEGVNTNSFYISPVDFDKMFMSFTKCLEHGQNLLKALKENAAAQRAQAEEAKKQQEISVQIPNAKTIHMDQTRISKAQQILASQYGIQFYRGFVDHSQMLDEISNMTGLASSRLNSEKQKNLKKEQLENHSQFHKETLKLVMDHVTDLEANSYNISNLFDSIESISSSKIPMMTDL